VAEYTGDIYKKAKDCDVVVLVTAHTDYEFIDFLRLEKVMAKAKIADRFIIHTCRAMYRYKYFLLRM